MIVMGVNFSFKDDCNERKKLLQNDCIERKTVGLSTNDWIPRGGMVIS